MHLPEHVQKTRGLEEPQTHGRDALLDFHTMAEDHWQEALEPHWSFDQVLEQLAEALITDTWFPHLRRGKKAEKLKAKSGLFFYFSLFALRWRGWHFNTFSRHRPMVPFHLTRHQT